MIGHRFTWIMPKSYHPTKSTVVPLRSQVDTATDASSSTTTATYLEVQELLDKAWLYGQQKRMEEGYKAVNEKGLRSTWGWGILLSKDNKMLDWLATGAVALPLYGSPCTWTVLQHHVKCWVQRELARESNGSPSEGTEGTWLQLIRSCILCWLHGSRFQSESKSRRESWRYSEREG